MGRLHGGSYWVLCALADGDAHGYLIAQRIQVLAEDEVRVGTGTLYAAIERLLADGFIRLVKEEVFEGRNRRTYRITGTGRKAAIEETERRRTAIVRASTQLGLA